MRVPIVRGIDKDTGKEVEGFYFEYPETTYCMVDDYLMHPVKMISCIMSYRMTDWGLPNEATITRPVDKSSLKIIGYREVGKEHFQDSITQVTEVDRVQVGTLIENLIYLKDNHRSELQLNEIDAINDVCNLLEHNTLIER